MPRARRPFWAAVVRRTAFLWFPLGLIFAAVWDAFGRIVCFVFDLAALGLDWIFWHHVDTPGDPYDVASVVYEEAPWAFSRADLNAGYEPRRCRGAVVVMSHRPDPFEWVVVMPGNDHTRAGDIQRRILAPHERVGRSEILAPACTGTCEADRFHRWATLEEIQAAPELRDLPR